MQQYEINARVYHRHGVERHYRDLSLTRAEGVALLRHQPAFADRDVLDIGVGTGRTAVYLAAVARHYQATDYSPVMVRYMREAMPAIPVLLADMRHMPGLADASFDFVLASNCVFDAVDHDGRLATLREIHRLLRPGGLLVFTGHNRNWTHALHGPRLGYSHNPATQAMLALHWILGWINRARLHHLERFTDEYAILNDGGHDFALMHYNITPDLQRRQLARQGFEVVEVLDQDGTLRAPGDPATECTWLMYVARRAAAPRESPRPGTAADTGAPLH